MEGVEYGVTLVITDPLSHSILGIQIFCLCRAITPEDRMLMLVHNLFLFLLDIRVPLYERKQRADYRVCGATKAWHYETVILDK